MKPAFKTALSITVPITILIVIFICQYIKEEKALIKDVDEEILINRKLQEEQKEKNIVNPGDTILLGCEGCAIIIFSHDPFSLKSAFEYIDAKDDEGLHKLKNHGLIKSLPNKTMARFIIYEFSGISRVRLLESEYSGKEVYISSERHILSKYSAFYK